MAAAAAVAADRSKKVARRETEALRRQYDALGLFGLVFSHSRRRRSLVECKLAVARTKPKEIISSACRASETRRK